MTQEEFFFLIGVLCSFVPSVTFYISVFFSLFLFFYCCSQASLQKKRRNAECSTIKTLYLVIYLLDVSAMSQRSKSELVNWTTWGFAVSPS